MDMTKKKVPLNNDHTVSTTLINLTVNQLASLLQQIVNER